MTKALLPILLIIILSVGVAATIQIVDNIERKPDRFLPSTFNFSNTAQATDSGQQMQGITYDDGIFYTLMRDGNLFSIDAYNQTGDFIGANCTDVDGSADMNQPNAIAWNNDLNQWIVGGRENAASESTIFQVPGNCVLTGGIHADLNISEIRGLAWNGSQYLATYNNVFGLFSSDFELLTNGTYDNDITEAEGVTWFNETRMWWVLDRATNSTYEFTTQLNSSGDRFNSTQINVPFGLTNNATSMFIISGNPNNLTSEYSQQIFKVFFEIRDEFSDTNIRENVTISLVGNESASFITANGTLNLSVPHVGEYAISYTSPQHETRFYHSILGDRHRSITLYNILTANSSTIKVLVKDENFNNLENATVQALRYYITDNTFRIVEMTRTGFDGASQVHLQQDGEDYKFRIIYLNDTKFQSIATIIRSYHVADGINFQINKEGDPLKNVETLTNVEAGVSFNNVTNTFLFIFNDASGTVTQACLDIFKIEEGQEVRLNQSCTNADSGTISISVDNNLTSSMVGEGVLTIDQSGVRTTLVADQATAFFDIRNIVTSLGAQGLFYLGLFATGIALTMIFEPKAAIIATSVAFVIPVIAGLSLFSITAALGVMAGGIIIAATMTTRAE